MLRGEGGEVGRDAGGHVVKVCGRLAGAQHLANELDEVVDVAGIGHFILDLKESTGVGVLVHDALEHLHGLVSRGAGPLRLALHQLVVLLVVIVEAGEVEFAGVSLGEEVAEFCGDEGLVGVTGGIRVLLHDRDEAAAAAVGGISELVGDVARPHHG